MAILPETNLETADYEMPQWAVIFNANFQKLNDSLLKLTAMLDVDTTDIVDGAVLVWDSTAAMWKAKKF